MTDTRWTEQEHLPEWDEEFYHIYTAKKFGKWVMIKTLKPEYREDPVYQEMIGREFDARYNLAHPNIVMINDFEDIPGIGMSIVTDDVYGDSMRKLITEHKLTEHHLNQVSHQLLDALEYIQSNHIVHSPLRPENIIFTENIGNLKLIDVGFDQRPRLSPDERTEDIYNFGVVLTEVLDALDNNDPTLRHVAKRCTDPNPKKRYADIQHIRFALQNRPQQRLLILLVVFMAIMALLLLWMLSPYRPDPIIHSSTGIYSIHQILT